MILRLPGPAGQKLLNYVSQCLRFDPPQDSYKVEYVIFCLLCGIRVPRRSRFFRKAEQALIATACDGDLEPEVRELASDILKSLGGVGKDAAQ